MLARIVLNRIRIFVFNNVSNLRFGSLELNIFSAKMISKRLSTKRILFFIFRKISIWISLCYKRFQIVSDLSLRFYHLNLDPLKRSSKEEGLETSQILLISSKIFWSRITCENDHSSVIWSTTKNKFFLFEVACFEKPQKSKYLSNNKLRISS